MSSRQGLRCMIINCSKNNRERKDLLTCCKFKDNRYTRYIHYIYKTIIFYVLARFLHKNLGKIFFFDIHIVSIVSSVSARKLKFPSSAWHDYIPTLLYEMPSNYKGKNFVSKIYCYCPQNTME